MTPAATGGDCTCLGGPNDPREGDLEACVAGTVYIPCEYEDCGGVCEPAYSCDCHLHQSPTHDSGYGGTYRD